MLREYQSRGGAYGPHAIIFMRLDSACHLVVRVAANEHFVGTLRLARGTTMLVRGEYEYGARGGVIHWTHRDPRGHHPNGYVLIAGRLYE